MKFTNSAGQPITLGQATFAVVARVVLTLVALGCMYAGTVALLCM